MIVNNVLKSSTYKNPCQSRPKSSRRPFIRNYARRQGLLTIMHKNVMLFPYLATIEFSRHTVRVHSHFAVFILAKLCLKQQSRNTVSNLPLSGTLDSVGLEIQMTLIPTSDINENQKRETQNKPERYLIKGW